jgi:molybdate transport system permease protein
MHNITPEPEKKNKKIRILPSVFDSLAGGMLFIYVAFIALLVLVDVGYIHARDFWSLFRSEDLRYAMRLSLITSTISALLSLIVGLPVGYALSRFRFRGRIIVDTLVDLPIVLPPLVIGVSLLVFFQTAIGRAIENAGFRFVYTPQGIVLAQFTVVSAYAVRTIKIAFDGIDPRLERVARTLGWSRLQAFFRVTLPMARNGILAAGVMAWSHAIGLFAPLMIFAGTTRRKTEVLATSIYLELSIGRIETALAITLLLVVFAMVAVTIVKKYVGDSSAL